MTTPVIRVPAGVLAQVRDLHRRWLAGTGILVDVQRRTTTDGPYGQTTTLATVLSGLPASVVPATRPQVERLVGGYIEENAYWSITLPMPVAVERADRLVLNDGREFEVVGIDGPRTIDLFRTVIGAPR